MATQKPLSKMVPEILEHIQANQEYLQFNLRVFNILEGQIKREIEASLRQEILSPSALSRCLQRIPALNILQKTTDKLSKVYIEAPVRKADKSADQEVMDSITKISSLDTALMQANRLLTAQNSCAIEPYVQDRQQRFRALPNHTFLPYSDDPINPLRMTVFIKFLGSETIVDYTTTGKDGTNKEQSKENVRVVDIVQLFSDDEIIVMDTSGRVRPDIMEKMGLDGSNAFGVIPQTYINSSHFMLLPYVNQMGLDISVLIPKLLTDLNYAAQFMSHSIVWTKNVDLEGASINPDAIVNLGDKLLDGGDPEIGTIDPKVQIESQLQLIEFEFSAYMSTVGIKTASVGAMMPGREASGFAKAMDEGDATAVRKELSELFRHVEKDFWAKLAMVQAAWASAGEVDEGRKFSSDFMDSFSVRFAEPKILKTDKEKYDELKVLHDLGAISVSQIVKEIKPDFTAAQVDAWMDEVKKEKDEQMEAMFNDPNMNPMGSDKDPKDDGKESDPAIAQRKETLGE